MDIGSLAISVALVILVWWGPGWLIGEALGVRRLYLPAAAPLIGVGALSSIGSAGHVLGMSWDPISVAVVTVVLAAILFVARMLLGRFRRRTGETGRRRSGEGSDAEREASGGFFGKWAFRGAWLLVIAGVVVGGVIAAATWTVGTEGLQGINQDWDIPWHANMVRLIAETHSWDPSLAGNFAYYDTTIADAPIRSYPIAFHALLALVWPFSGVSIPVFLNIFVAVLMAVQLPLSAVALTSLLTRRPVALAAVAVVSGWFTVFPFDLLWRGPLIPFFAGMVLAGPFCLLAARGSLERRWWWLPAIAFGAVALIGVHPSLAFVVAPVLVFWLIPVILRRRLKSLVVIGYLALAGILGAVLGAGIVLDMLKEANRVSKQVWAADTDKVGAVENILLLHHGSMPQVILSVLVGIGCIAMVARMRMWWYLGPVLAFAFLSVYTMGTNAPQLLTLTAPFYDDQWRIFGILVMLLIPLAGLGVAQIGEAVEWVVRFVAARRTTASRAQAGGRRNAVVAVTAVVVLLVAGVGARPYFAENAGRIGINTKVDGATLSSSEVHLLTTIGQYVPKDATVLNDSCDGSVWMYALGDRMPMIRHFEILPTNRQLLVLQKLPDLATDPAVRKAASELGIEWVYIASGTIRAWDEAKPGLTHPDSIPFMKLVVRDGNAALYKIDWSQLPGGRAAFDADNVLRKDFDNGNVPGVMLNTDPDGIAPLGRIC